PGSARRAPSPSLDGEEAPGSGDALQLLGSTVLELEAGAGHKVPDRAGDQDLTGPCLRGHPGTDMDRDAGELVAEHLALARVQARSELQADSPHGVSNGARAPDRSGRP